MIVSTLQFLGGNEEKNGCNFLGWIGAHDRNHPSILGVGGGGTHRITHPKIRAGVKFRTGTVGGSDPQGHISPGTRRRTYGMNARRRRVEPAPVYLSLREVSVLLVC